MKDCKVEIKCTVEGCDKQDSHHTLMHKFELHDNETYKNAKDSAAICSCAAMHSSSHLLHWNRPYLMTVPVTVRSANKKIQTYALLDTGSELTFCDRRIVDELELTGPERRISVQPFSTMSRSEEVCGLNIQMSVSPMCGGDEMTFKNVIAVDYLPFDECLIPKRKVLELWGDY